MAFICARPNVFVRVASGRASHAHLAVGAPPANCCYDACLTQAPRLHIIAVLKGETMSGTLNLKISVAAAGDTTPGEIADAARRLSVALAERPEVETVTAATAPAPEGAKPGAEVVALGALLLAVAPAAVEGVLALIRDLLARMGTMPTKVTVERAGQKVAVEFDPRRTSVEDISALARTLAGQMDES